MGFRFEETDCGFALSCPSMNGRFAPEPAFHSLTARAAASPELDSAKTSAPPKWRSAKAMRSAKTSAPCDAVWCPDISRCHGTTVPISSIRNNGGFPFARHVGAKWIAFPKSARPESTNSRKRWIPWRNGDRSSVLERKLHRTKRCSPEANTACPSQAHMPYSIFSSPLARSAMTMPSAGKYSFSSFVDERCPSIRKPSFNGRVSFALAALSRLS